jgi:glycosyltransferase involved in cell wall biosynthesis
MPLTDPQCIRVSRMFQLVLGRDATGSELSRYRLVPDILLRGIVDTIKYDSKEIIEKETLYNKARTQVKRPGVSLVSTYNSMCGIATYTENLYKSLKHLSFPANVVSDATRNRSDPSTELGVIPSFSVEAMDFDEKIINGVVQAGNKIVHIQHEFGLYKDNAKLSLLIGLLRSFGYRVVITLHTLRTEKHFDQFYRHADCIVVHSEMAACRLYSNGVNNVTVIMHGTEDPLEIDIAEAKKFVSQFIPASKVLCTYPGFICQNKMQIEAMKAAMIAIRECSDLNVLLIGSTGRQGYDNKYYSELKKLEFPGRLHIVDKFLSKREMGLVLVASDFAIMNYDATHYSTSGMCHYLLTYGTPSVSSNSRILEDLNSGISIKIDPRDIKGMASAIVRLVKDTSLREQFRQGALGLGKATSWIEQAKKHVSVYNHLLS